jgi:hypothetical protein
MRVHDRNPSRMRKITIFVVALIMAVLLSMWLGGGKANAQPVAGCFNDAGEKINCLDRWTSGPFSREGSEKLRKSLGVTALGCAGGLAAGGPVGLYYGCAGAGLGSLWDLVF